MPRCIPWIKTQILPPSEFKVLPAKITIGHVQLILFEFVVSQCIQIGLGGFLVAWDGDGIVEVDGLGWLDFEANEDVFVVVHVGHVELVGGEGGGAGGFEGFHVGLEVSFLTMSWVPVVGKIMCGIVNISSDVS